MDSNFNNYGKNISWVQILFLFCIILLTACDFIILSTGNIRTIGITLFIVGVVTIIIAAIKKNSLKGRMWLLADGTVTTLLSVLLLSGITTPLFFAIWETALGSLKIGEALRLKGDLKDNNRSFICIGIIEIVSGIGFLTRSGDRITDYAIAIVIAFALQMSAYALRYYFYPLMTED